MLVTKEVSKLLKSKETKLLHITNITFISFTPVVIASFRLASTKLLLVTNVADKLAFVKLALLKFTFLLFLNDPLILEFSKFAPVKSISLIPSNQDELSFLFEKLALLKFTFKFSLPLLIIALLEVTLVKFKPLIFKLTKLLLPANKLEPISVTFEVSRLDISISVRFIHPLNILAILVVNEVSRLDKSIVLAAVNPLK